MNLFRRPSVRYDQTPAPETPYQRATQVWDERIGSARVQAKNWRLIAFGNLVLASGLAVGLVWQSARGTVVPWVVQVDKLGEAQAVAPAISDYKPADPQIAWHLARFIEQVRSVPADPVIVRQNCLALMISPPTRVQQHSTITPVPMTPSPRSVKFRLRSKSQA
jgi:type IV secretion system protein TrbF